MLAKIDDFLFDLNKNDIDSIQHQLSLTWNRQTRLGNHQYTQREGSWEETLSFGGKLLMQSVNALKEFEDLVKTGKPVRLTLGTGESYEVTINSLDRTKKSFLKDGKYRHQEYSISLQRYFK